MFELKKKSIILLLAFMCAFSMASCNKPQSLADFIDTHDSVKSTLESLDSSRGFDMSVDGNTISCEYDIMNVPDITVDAAKYKDNVKAFEDSLDAQSESYSEFCKMLEEESGIEGITLVVSYTFHDEVIASREFTASE